MIAGHGVFWIQVHSRLRWPWKTALGLRTPSVAPPAARRPDDRGGGVPAAVAAQPRAVREVDVFVDGKERFVEPLQLLEHRAPNHERGAARADHLPRRPDLGRRGPA